MFVLGLTLSGYAFSQNLKCEQSYKIFEEYFSISNQIDQSGDLKKLIEFNKQYDYQEKFKVNHPNQIYFGSEWVDAQEFDIGLTVLLEFTKSDHHQNLNDVFKQPKVNYISSVGEVCVIPWVNKSVMFNKEYLSETDVIFVRDLKDDKWRFTKYVGSESKIDFEELFPDFPNRKLLQAAVANGQYIYSEDAENLSIKIFESVLKIDLPEDAKQAIKASYKDNMKKLNDNGYF